MDRIPDVVSWLKGGCAQAVACELAGPQPAPLADARGSRCFRTVLSPEAQEVPGARAVPTNDPDAMRSGVRRDDCPTAIGDEAEPSTLGAEGRIGFEIML